MKTLFKNDQKLLSWSDDSTTKILQELLLQGEIIIADTDTIPGFLAPVTLQGYQKLREIKGDRGEKPFLVLISASQLARFVNLASLNRGVLALTQQCWPGPLTIIFNARPESALHLVSSTGTIALRCPAHEGLQQLLAHVPGLFAPSANRSNQTPPQSIYDVDQELIAAAASVVGDRKKMNGPHASTIIDVSNVKTDVIAEKSKISVVREGVYPKALIERIYESAYSE